MLKAVQLLSETNATRSFSAIHDTGDDQNAGHDCRYDWAQGRTHLQTFPAHVADAWTEFVFFLRFLGLFSSPSSCAAVMTPRVPASVSFFLLKWLLVLLRRFCMLSMQRSLLVETIEMTVLLQEIHRTSEKSAIKSLRISKTQRRNCVTRM